MITETTPTATKALAKSGCDYPRAGKHTLLGAYRVGQKLEQLPQPLTAGQAIELNRLYKQKVCEAIRTLDVPEYLKKYPTAVYTPNKPAMRAL